MVIQKQNFKLRRIVHLAAQYSKNMVDAHFTVSKSHIVRFVNGTGNDVIIPEDVVEAL